MPFPQCSNNLKVTHTTKALRTEVRKCSESTISDYRRYLTEYSWQDNTKLCTSCRFRANQLLQRRIQATGILNLVRKSTGTTSNLLGPDIAPAGIHNEESSVEIEEAFQEEAPNGTPASIIITEGSSSVPSSAPLSFPLSDFQCDSDPRERLNNVLQVLGESPLQAKAKDKPLVLKKKFSQSCSALASLFCDMSTNELNKNDNKCQHCEKIAGAIKKKLPETKSHQEKYMMLTALPPEYTINRINNEFGVSIYTARKVSNLRNMSGPFSVPDYQYRPHSIDPDIIALVKGFYLSDSNSRPSPNARETLQVKDCDGQVRTEARRWMLGSAREMYSEFKNGYPHVKIGMTKFLEYRPIQCKWQGNYLKYNTCTCIHHENFKFMLEAVAIGCKSAHEETHSLAGVDIESLETCSSFLKSILCANPTEDCFEGFCPECPNQLIIDNIFTAIENDVITFKAWESTISTNLVISQTEVASFKEKFLRMIPKFINHDFVYTQQKSAIYNLKQMTGLSANVAVILVDFGQNYSFVIQNAVQGFHWNNSQATIHPFVVYVRNEQNQISYKTYFGISDDLSHDCTAFHCMRKDMLALLQLDFPSITHIEYISDGASHYKSRFNVANLVYHKFDFDLTANWTFSATSHGKSTCDAMSAVAKRGWRSLSLKGAIITSAEAMFKEAIAHLSTDKLQFFYTKRERISEFRGILQERYGGTKAIPGLRSFHSIKITEDGSVIVRKCSSSLTFEKHSIFTELQRQTFVAASSLLVGKFYAVFCNSNYQIGQLVKVDATSGLAKFTMLKKTGRGGNTLVYPIMDIFFETDFQNILSEVADPSPTSTGYLSLSVGDRERVKEELIVRMQTVFVTNDL